MSGNPGIEDLTFGEAHSVPPLTPPTKRRERGDSENLSILQKGVVKPNSIVVLSRIKREITSREMAAIDRISVQNASNQLRVLFEAGFLKREQLEDETGGYFYVYSKSDAASTKGEKP